MLSLNNPLLWRGLLLSLTAVAFFLFLAWWLYRSPLSTPVAVADATSPRLAVWLAALLSLSALQLTIGALWDASMHLQTGEIPAGADFLWPPHIMIYSSFLFSLLVGLAAIGVIAVPNWQVGMRDPRCWVRGHPYVGAVAVASLYMILALPGDAVWHEIVGIDLTAWSPPHLMIGLTNAAVMVSAAGLLTRARQQMRQQGLANIAVILLLALMLNVVYLIGVLEWEIPNGGAHLSRPVWLYPVVAGGLAFFTLLLAKYLVPYRWTATVLTGLFYCLRLSIMAGLSVTENVVPALPALFILGAILMDLVMDRPQLIAPAFVAGYVALAFPLLNSTSNVRGFGLVEALIATAWLLSVSIVSHPLVYTLVRRLLLSESEST